MTVSASDYTSGPFIGNSLATTFAFDFKVFAKADIRAVLTEISTGAGTELALDSDYSVTLNADQNTSPGGSITYPISGSPMTSAYRLTLASNLTIEQSTDLTNLGGFYPQVIEDALDRTVMLIGQQNVNYDRAIKISVPASSLGISTDLPAPVPGSALGWNGAGDAIINIALSTGTSLVDLAAANGSDLIGNQAPGVGSVLRTVGAKMDEFFSVKDKGATGLGVVSDTAAFTAAGSQGADVTVRVTGPAIYKLDTTPTPTGSVLWIIDKGATFTGVGAPYMASGGAGRQYLQADAGATDFATVYVRRNATYTGGTPGYVNSGFRADTYVSAGSAAYEWAIVGVVDSSATGGQNVGVYGQGLRRSTGPVWGMVAEVKDFGGNNPTSGVLGIEVDVRANGTDDLFQKIGIDIVNDRNNVGGSANICGYGVRLQNGGDVGSVYRIGYGTTAPCEVFLDCSTATISVAAMRMAAGHAIAWEATSAKVSYQTGGGLAYRVSGDIIHEIRDDGVVRYKSLTVAQLPSAGNVGARAFVTNATSNTRGSVVAGGGSIKVPVYDDGGSWLVD